MSHLGREITESIHDTGSASMRRQKGNARRGIGRAHRLPMSAVGLVCSDSPAKTREEHHASDLLRRSQTHWFLTHKKKSPLMSQKPMRSLISTFLRASNKERARRVAELAPQKPKISLPDQCGRDLLSGSLACCSSLVSAGESLHTSPTADVGKR